MFSRLCTKIRLYSECIIQKKAFVKRPVGCCCKSVSIVTFLTFKWKKTFYFLLCTLFFFLSHKQLGGEVKQTKLKKTGRLLILFFKPGLWSCCFCVHDWMWFKCVSTASYRCSSNLLSLKCFLTALKKTKQKKTARLEISRQTPCVHHESFSRENVWKII